MKDLQMDDQRVNKHLDKIKQLSKTIDHEVSIMEVCGTHTVSLMRSGVKSMLPKSIRLISGPGCPVCVTSQGYIDTACRLSLYDNVITCTYGDMLRVPGDNGSLENCQANGADVRIVYSARDAVEIAQKNPKKNIVFLAVGFETTTPPTALAIREACARKIENFYVLPAHKLVIPAMQILLSDKEINIDGFLCPGHVSIIIGADAYKPIVDEFSKPCVVAGFESEQMLSGIEKILQQIANDSPCVENVYSVAVKPGGNPHAKKLLDEFFKPADVTWRAMGILPKSGLELKEEYKKYDAREKFGVEFSQDREIPGCMCGSVIQGKMNPPQCPLFAKKCTPYAPIGPCMVSSEGTCAAWFKYSNK